METSSAHRRFEKAQEVQRLLYLNDIPGLRQACVSEFGLVSDKLRAKAWPLLLCPLPLPWHERKEHRDERQIDLDCNRSFYNYDVLTGLSGRLRSMKVGDLTEVLNQVFLQSPELYYYQGFHDICTVLLLVCGNELAYPLAHRLALSHFRDCMRETLNQGLVQQVKLIYALLGQKDPELAEWLQQISPEMVRCKQPMVALPLVMAGFQHDIEDYQVATRIFDFLISTHPSASIYLCAALFQLQKPALLACEDMSELHEVFKSSLRTADFDQICLFAYETMKECPPGVLAALSEEPFEPE